MLRPHQHPIILFKPMERVTNTRTGSEHILYGLLIMIFVISTVTFFLLLAEEHNQEMQNFDIKLDYAPPKE